LADKGFGMSQATSYRNLLHEVIDVLAARAPDLCDALAQVRDGNLDFGAGWPKCEQNHYVVVATGAYVWRGCNVHILKACSISLFAVLSYVPREVRNEFRMRISVMYLKTN